MACPFLVFPWCLMRPCFLFMSAQCVCVWISVCICVCLLAVSTVLHEISSIRLRAQILRCALKKQLARSLARRANNHRVFLPARARACACAFAPLVPANKASSTPGGAAHAAYITPPSSFRRQPREPSAEGPRQASLAPGWGADSAAGSQGAR